MTNLLNELNPQQQEAVTYLGGPLLVLAGAGSGKTRVITYRIAYLIVEHTVRPTELIAVTFTNKAAEEMKSRVTKLLHTDLQRMWVSTFHSACVRILRRNIHLLGYHQDFSIYDTEDQLDLVRDCFKELELDTKQWNPRAVLGEISRAKNRLVSPEEYIPEAHKMFQQIVKSVYDKYQEKLIQSNAVDFDDLLWVTVRLFEQFPEVLNYYQNQFKHILVDEYQDTNKAQYLLVRMLAKQHHQICVVGDDDQSIYGWRGADIRNILNFEQDYPKVNIVTLTQNYRSTRNILEVANRLILRNPRRHEKHLRTTKPEGIPPTFYLATNEIAESTWVCQQLIHWKGALGRKYRNAAVFYRTHAQSRVLEDMLRSFRIPYVIVSGIRFYERKEIKDLLAYLRILVNPADDISIERILNVPSRALGKITLTRVKQYAAEQQISLYAVLQHANEIKTITSATKNKLAGFVDLVSSFHASMQAMPASDLLKKLIDRIEYFEYLKSFDPEESESRIDNVKELVSAVREFELRSEDKSLASFLNEVSLVTNMDIQTEDADMIQLMTLHSAKGLEFPLVFIIGMEEKIFPCIRDEDHLDFIEAIEEERRLCYVGITRAKEQLMFTAAFSRRQYGQVVYNPPSRFLAEINLAWVKQINTVFNSKSAILRRRNYF